jgi:hypothetical protein
MKICRNLFFSITFCFIWANAFSQVGKQPYPIYYKTIHRAKETKKVDSLVEAFQNSKALNDDFETSKDSIFLIVVGKGGADLNIYHITGIRTMIEISKSIAKDPNLTYFTFKNSLVLVTGDTKSSHLFAITSGRKLFKFRLTEKQAK